MSRNKPSSPPHLLPEEEWNFDKVPDDQKLDCLYYELGRESATYRKRKSQLTRVVLADTTIWLPPKADLPIVPIADRTIFTTRLTFGEFCDRYQPLLGFFPETPWPSLPLKLRNTYSSEEGLLTGMEKPCFLKAFVAENELNPFSSLLYGAQSEKGLVTIDCTINWSHCNEAIIREFTDWVKKEGDQRRLGLGVKEQYRKPGILADQKGRGFKQVRSNLDDLAVVRLLRGRRMDEALATAMRFKSLIPHKSDSAARKWRARKSNFKSALQRYFADIPDDERPRG